MTSNGQHLDHVSPQGREARTDQTQSPTSVPAGPPGSPLSLPSFSPASRHRRLRNYSKRNIEILLGTSPPSSFVAHVPRDPIQPRSGSISDVHSEASYEEEAEIDFFPESLNSLPFRPRSHTCPENRSWLRKIRARNRNRPPTPPPGGVDDVLLECEITKQATRDKLRVSNHTLPLAIPENPGRDRGAGLDTTYKEQEIFSMEDA